MDEKKNEGQTNQEKKEENSYEFLKETIKAEKCFENVTEF